MNYALGPSFTRYSTSWQCVSTPSPPRLLYCVISLVFRTPNVLTALPFHWPIRPPERYLSRLERIIDNERI
ncbi:hypothetical protein P691DRAFT_470863 [Macrolepiota fuliginosa MF-IS2]|uniref:Uncharacterized protein n=1 Tax=Macrolepiota fuliginosa MF-IS2 TaxID=1400762 RepID=A0A9P5X392_9AGAR|nr:hypothetical protein P691DRAFT_470863 [Macrolepiota fuliginosa MF-IS2]